MSFGIFSIYPYVDIINEYAKFYILHSEIPSYD